MDKSRLTNLLTMSMLILLTVAVIYLNYKANHPKNFNNMTDVELVEEIINANNK